MAIKQKIEAEFDAKGTQQYAGAMGVLARSASGAGQVLSNVLNVVNPLNLALGSLAAGGALAGIAHVASEFEDVQIRMAGTLQALHFVDDFERGMSNAAELTRRIHADAAALPGEASDYVAVFTQALPQISQSMSGSLDEMTRWSNRFTAISTSLGVESAQAGRDLMRMLQAGRGRAGQMVVTFNRLLPFIQGLEGHANLTAAAFNEMSQPERWAILDQAMAGLDDQLQASADSFSAIVGASETVIHNMTRWATGPLFDSMKSSLQRINALFIDIDGEATAFGESLIRIGTFLSTGFVSIFEYVVELMEDIARKWDGFMTGVFDSPIIQTLARIVDDLGGMTAGGAAGAAGGGLAAAGFMAAGGPVGPALAAIAALGAGIANFLTRTEAVSEVLGIMGSIFRNVAVVVQPLVGFFNIFSRMMGDVIAGILPGFLRGVEAVTAVFFPMVAGMIGITNTILESVQPTLEAVWHHLGRLAQALLEIYANALTPFALGVLEVALFLSNHLSPGFTDLLEGLRIFIEGLANFVSWISEMTGRMVESMAAENAARQGAPDWYHQARAAILGLASASDEAAAAQRGAEDGATAPSIPRRPGGRGGGRVVQDFRYSRFEIEQKFEEGFDPDRIAVAFAQDIGSLGENRLQSGFEPVFGIR